MDLVKTGAGLTKTIKNVGRLREILSVLATNGFDEFILQTKLHEKIGFVLPRARLKLALSEKKDGELCRMLHLIQRLKLLSRLETGSWFAGPVTTSSAI